VEEIGPAVFNGGFTTFLALALLGFSTSQIFITFFKVLHFI
jgi:Niemann-Pick C1 protein